MSVPLLLHVPRSQAVELVLAQPTVQHLEAASSGTHFQDLAARDRARIEIAPQIRSALGCFPTVPVRPPGRYEDSRDRDDAKGLVPGLRVTGYVKDQ